MEEPMETARQWRYYVGAIKIIVPEGQEITVGVDGQTFWFNGYRGVFETAQIPQFLRDGSLRRKP